MDNAGRSVPVGDSQSVTLMQKSESQQIFPNIVQGIDGLTVFC